MFKWVKTQSNKILFWTAPCTLIFEEVHGLEIQFESRPVIRGDVLFYIYDVLRTKKEDPQAGWVENEWKIDLRNFGADSYISFSSSGLTQVVRQKPIQVDDQCLRQQQRGGISFSQEPRNVRT